MSLRENSVNSIITEANEHLSPIYSTEATTCADECEHDSLTLDKLYDVEIETHEPSPSDDSNCPSPTFADAKRQLKLELESCREMYLSILQKKQSLHDQNKEEQTNAFQQQVDQGMTDFKAHYEMERNALKEFIRTKKQEFEDTLENAHRQQIQNREKKLREATHIMMNKVFEIRSEFEESESIKLV